MSLRVTCPSCKASLTPPVGPGVKFACPCGQKMRLPAKPPRRRTALVTPDDDPVPDRCRHCGGTDVVRGERTSNPWGWGVLLVGAFSTLSGATTAAYIVAIGGPCIAPLAFSGLPLVLAGGALRQDYASCGSCSALRLGRTRIGWPSWGSLLFALGVSLLALASAVALPTARP